jgi:hypothetical protein
VSIYYVELVDVLTAAGVVCRVDFVNEGWERRARSSGGFSSPPLACCWHHTASSASPEADLNWMIHGSDDAPIGNLLLDRGGVVWPIAAGAANTQGKGGPATFSRGVCPVDNGNSRLWGMEVANNGLGEPWPLAQIDAYFKASNALNELFGNQPNDVITHQVWAPDRKIDPATTAAVQGPWHPAAVTSSGTWSLDDIRFECARRWNGLPPVPKPQPPLPDPEEDLDVAFIIVNTQTGQPALVYGSGKVTGLAGEDLAGYEAQFGTAIPTDDVVFRDFANKE